MGRLASRTDEIIAMYQGKMKVAAIAAEMEAYPNQIYEILRKNGIPLQDPIGFAKGTPQERAFLAVSEKQRQTIVDGVKNGRAISELATELKVTYNTVRMAAHHLKLELKPGARARQVTFEEEEGIVRDWVAGNMAVGDLLIKHDISGQRLRKILHTRGIMSKVIKNKAAQTEAVVQEITARMEREMKVGEAVVQMAFAEVFEAATPAPTGVVKKAIDKAYEELELVKEKKDEH